MRVRLVTHEGLMEYDTVVLSDDGNRIVVRAEYSEPEPRDLGYVHLVLGDIWTEQYWRDRWYSVKAVTTPAGELKGWYCDAARPAEIADGLLVSVDLELDLWVSANREVILRLDEDEFLELGLPDQFPEAAAAAQAAIDELERLASAGDPPFDDSFGFEPVA